MPVTVIWPLSAPVAVSPFSPPPSLPPIIGSVLECSADWYDQDDLLAVVSRSYPLDYLDSLRLLPNAGYEIFQGATKVMERVSIAVMRRYCCSFVSTAVSGAKAVGVVEFYRANADAGAITLSAGTVVRTSSGKEFVTTADAVFGGAALGPVTAAIEAALEGYEYNVPGQVSTAGGETLPGDINDIKTMVTPTPAFDVEMRVRNVAATTGGRDKCLDAAGEDRGIPRGLQESNDAYRFRILNTPDAISPAAIRRGVNAILFPFDAEVCLREVGTPLFPGFFYDAGSSVDSPQNPRNNYAYDMDFDARPEDRFKLWLSTLEFRGFFLLGVPELVESEYFGLVYDGSDADTFRLKNAYDTTTAVAPNAGYDGFTVLNSTIYKAISDTVTKKKAGGVGFDLYVEAIGCF
jgi:hypothetical protein